jgi:hypothetical protein
VTVLPCLTEAEESHILVAWLRVKGLTFTHIGNETGHTPEARRRAIRLKQQGVSRGFPDYCVLLPGIGVVYIELKRLHGSHTSPEQKAWVEALNACPGTSAHICRGARVAIETIESYMVH